MTRRLLLTIFVALALLPAWGGSRLDSLLQVLDDVIEHSGTYAAQKQTAITRLKAQLGECGGDPERLYGVHRRLYEEYRALMFDSAVYHLNECIACATRAGNAQRLAESRIRLSYLYGSGGRYEAALDLLQSIDRATLPAELLADYYSSYDHSYGEMVSYHVGGGDLAHVYASKLKAYKDSLYSVLPRQSRLYMQLEENRCRDAHHADSAMLLNDRQLAMLTPDSAAYPLVLYHRAQNYGIAGDSVAQMECFARSAIADIRLAKKDHASLWMLANMLFNAGDIERASRYMQFSWVDTNFYNSPLRFWQTSNTQKLIDSRYQQLIAARSRRLVMLVILTSALAVLLLLSLLQIMRQKRKVTIAQLNLEESNGKLNELNARLSNMNEELTAANANLEESNCIKDVYISRFIKLCSEYIDRLEHLRANVHKSLSIGKVDEAKKLVKTSSATSDEVRLLYQNFDTAFLHIFPDFVAKFNALLRDDERIVPKSDELLTTELRIFALIRLGFTDSSQIAEILRYSVNTIYNYRAKVKNKARGNRADFEELVRGIH